MDTWNGPQVHWKDVLPMANEKEILTRFFKGDCQRTIADAILDRIFPGSNIMEIQGDVSMRQRLAEESV